jgi:hypothetical protein
MKRRAVLIIAGAAVALAGTPQRMSAQTVSACSGSGNCAQVSITPPSVSASPNGLATVGLTFQQGTNSIAALALTLSLSGSPGAVPLQFMRTPVDGCALNADGLPAAVKPDPSISSNFKVVVENVSCENGRTHCLCPAPGSGITPDNFINLVIYGPNPLPASAPVTIPTLPAGPQQLLTIDFQVASDASGTIPLHIYNQVDDSQHPQFTAFLSMGDQNAVDQTCVPVAGQPPCSGSATSQVKTNDGSIEVAGVTCAGDCDADGSVTVNEIIVLVNITLGSLDASACPHGIPSGRSVDITLIIQAVGYALNNCPAS